MGPFVSGYALGVARVRVKICCIASVEEARLAVSLGASALGLVSRMPSGPGVIDEAAIAPIAASVPPGVSTFLLTALTDADAIAEQHARCRTSTIQLVDRLAPGSLARLRAALPGITLVQVVHVLDDGAIDEAREASAHAHAILLDSGNPKLATKELGGTGRTHNWEISRRIRDAIDRPLYLAGGLNAGNVAEAVRVVEPFGVDLCSSVRTNGRLDAAKLRAFMLAAGV